MAQTDRGAQGLGQLLFKLADVGRLGRRRPPGRRLAFAQSPDQNLNLAHRQPLVHGLVEIGRAHVRTTVTWPAPTPPPRPASPRSRPCFPARRSSDLLPELEWRRLTGAHRVSVSSSSSLRMSADLVAGARPDGASPSRSRLTKTSTWRTDSPLSTASWRSEEHTSEPQSRGQPLRRLLVLPLRARAPVSLPDALPISCPSLNGAD